MVEHILGIYRTEFRRLFTRKINVSEYEECYQYDKNEGEFEHELLGQYCLKYGDYDTEKCQ
jgi:hypothetical protein